MTGISRREFLARASLAASATLVSPGVPQAAEDAPPPKRGTDLVPLGKTGIRTTLLGLGTGTHGIRRSSNQQKLGEAGFVALVRHAIERGIRYFDTADQYGTHLYLRTALRGVDRDRLFIQTKVRQTHPAAAQADIERFRQELGVDYIDSLLMHARKSETWPNDMRPVMDAMAEAKQKGRVRAVGISSHNLAPLKASVGCPWLDVQLAPINPFGVTMDATAEAYLKCFKALRAQGKGVIGMKIFGCGRKAKPPERLESLKFVLGSGGVDAIVIGFESPRQIDEVLAQIATALE